MYVYCYYHAIFSISTEIADRWVGFKGISISWTVESGVVGVLYTMLRIFILKLVRFNLQKQIITLKWAV